MTYSVSLALLLGLFSALHCLGMCGSIIGALTLGLPAEIRQSRARLFTYVMAYNLGRLSSYALAGALIGGLGRTLFEALSPRYGHTVLTLGAAGLMVAMGLYLAGWFPSFARLERMGLSLWRSLEPLGRRLLPVSSLTRAFAFGLVWGWLPCGLVYSLLLWTSSAGSAAHGAVYMLAFGLGTLPAVASAGILFGGLLGVLRKPYVRQTVGVTVIALALITLWMPGSSPHLLHGLG